MRYVEVHEEKKQLNKKLQDVTKKCEESEMEVERLRKAYENQSQWWWKRRSTTKSVSFVGFFIVFAFTNYHRMVTN